MSDFPVPDVSKSNFEPGKHDIFRTYRRFISSSSSSVLPNPSAWSVQPSNPPTSWLDRDSRFHHGGEMDHVGPASGAFPKPVASKPGCGMSAHEVKIPVKRYLINKIRINNRRKIFHRCGEG